jgi:hypothetical protein
MTQEEKLGGAIVALKMIANTEPHQEVKGEAYHCGPFIYEPCKECSKMIMIAKETLKELGVN